MITWTIHDKGWIKDGVWFAGPKSVEGYNIFDFFTDDSPVTAKDEAEASRIWLDRFKGADEHGIEPDWIVCRLISTD